jgi:hypothetical protein
MSATPGAIRSETSAGFVTNLQHRLLRQFKVQVADWQDTCRDLAAWEDRYLVESRAPERLAEHSALLDELERVGRWLASAGSESGLGDSESAQQIQLTLQDLLDSRALWHGQVSEARRREILRDCFNEP